MTWCTNTLLSLKWALTVTVSTGKALVVAGGYGEEYATLATVEVMDTDTLQWSTASSLPHPLSDATATVCGDRVYLGGGWDEHGYSTKSVFTCSLSALLHHRSKDESFVTKWKPPSLADDC